MDATAEDWVRVCAVEDIPLLGSRVLKREGGDDIALFRPAAARVFALADRCPHKGGPLSQGIVSGDTVTCPLHGWNIQLDSGQACAPAGRLRWEERRVVRECRARCSPDP